jgi:hypothetical protein
MALFGWTVSVRLSAPCSMLLLPTILVSLPLMNIANDFLYSFEDYLKLHKQEVHQRNKKSASWIVPSAKQNPNKSLVPFLVTDKYRAIKNV